MKKNIRFCIMIFVILILFLVIFIFARNMSLNNYLNKTIEYSPKINYSTSIILNIKDLNNSSKIEYNVSKFSHIRKIKIDNYQNNKLINNIEKYIVTNGNKKGTYIYDNSEYKKVNNIKEDFVVNYELIKKNIKSIKKVENVVINNISYKKYIVKMKAYDAYNIIYKDEILKKEDLNKIIDVQIYIDKSNNFVYKIKYDIQNLNNADEKNIILNYDAEITNTNINNYNEIKLPF